MSTNAQTIANVGSEQKISKKKLGSWRYVLALCGIIGFIMIASFVPDSTGLGQGGKYVLAILFLMVTWWISAICSILVTSVLGLTLMLCFKVATVKVVISGFSEQTVIFLVFAFIIAAAVTKTGLGKRLAYSVMARTRPKFGSMMITFVLISLAMGALIPSGSARTVLMGTIGMTLLPVFGQTGDKKSNVGRSIFTLLGLTSYMSSTAYLTGGAAIILTVGLLGKAGYSVTYLQWLVMAMPPILIVSILLALVVPRIFPPEVKDVTTEKFKEFQATLRTMGPMSVQEKKAAIIIGLVVFFLVIGDFLSVDYITVGAAGAVLLMFPFIGIVNDKDFTKMIPWDVVFFVGVCLTLGSVLQETKVTDFLALMVSPIMASSSLLIFCLKIWLIATAVHFILPSAQPAFATFLPIIIASAKSQELSVIIPVVVFVTSYTGLIMVYQQVHAVIAYGFKQFDANDLLKPGLLLIVLWLLMTPIQVFYLSMLGF